MLKLSTTAFKNSYNGRLIQKLRVKCSVTYFYIRSLAFSFVSYYTTHSPSFYKGLRFLERFYGVRANPRISLYARIVISPINYSTNLKLRTFFVPEFKVRLAGD